jgi:hypothetical protein
MTEHDASTPAELGDDGVPTTVSRGSASLSRDPALELFGSGWAPKHGPTDETDYTGRHRAPDA